MKPTPMSDDRVILCWSRATTHADVEHKAEHEQLTDFAQAIIAARDAQWQDLLSKQEPT